MKHRIVIIENNLLSTLTMRQQLTAELMKYFDITILSTGTNQQKKEAEGLGFKFIDVGTSNQNIFHIFSYLKNLRKVIKQIDPQLCLTFTIRPAIWGNLVTRLLGIRTITTITGIGPLFSQKALAYRGARMLYKYALKKTIRIFFQNREDMELFIQKEFVRASVCEYIPGSGVDPSHFQPAGLPTQETFSFLFIGRLVKDKGIYEFIQASQILRNKSIRAEYAILGPYWSQNLPANTITPEEMEEWVKKGNVKYLGEAKDVRSFIASAHCIVLPSYREGLNNVLLEASSMERPCITSDTTGCREIIEEGVNGFLCEVKNAESLAQKMEKMYLLTSEERIEMGRKGREKVIRDFDKKNVIKTYLDSIWEILSIKNT